MHRQEARRTAPAPRARRRWCVCGCACYWPPRHASCGTSHAPHWCTPRTTAAASAPCPFGARVGSRVHSCASCIQHARVPMRTVGAVRGDACPPFHPHATATARRVPIQGVRVPCGDATARASDRNASEMARRTALDAALPSSTAGRCCSSILALVSTSHCCRVDTADSACCRKSSTRRKAACFISRKLPGWWGASVVVGAAMCGKWNTV